MSGRFGVCEMMMRGWLNLGRHLLLKSSEGYKRHFGPFTPQLLWSSVIREFFPLTSHLSSIMINKKSEGLKFLLSALWIFSSSSFYCHSRFCIDIIIMIVFMMLFYFLRHNRRSPNGINRTSGVRRWKEDVLVCAEVSVKTVPNPKLVLSLYVIRSIFSPSSSSASMDSDLDTWQVFIAKHLSDSHSWDLFSLSIMRAKSQVFLATLLSSPLITTSHTSVSNF